MAEPFVGFADGLDVDERNQEELSMTVELLASVTVRWRCRCH